MRGFVALFMVSVAFAQTAVERTLQMQTAAERDRQEIVTAARTISDLRTLELKPDGNVRLAGPEAQVALGEWVLRELDQSAPGSAPSAIYDFPDPRGEGKTRIYYAPFTASVQDFQEMVTLVRTISDTRRVFQYNARRAMVMRGAEEQVALTAQLIDDLARHTGSSQSHAASDAYSFTGPSLGDADTSVRIFYAGHQQSNQELQGLGTLLRTITGVRRMFLQNSMRAIAARGTPDQIDLTQWLFDQIDRPAGSGGAAQERLVPGTQDIVRVMHVGSQFSEQNARDLAAQIQTNAALKGVKLYGHGDAIVVRGSVSQVLEVDRLSR